jgi:hypothetical protein
MPTKKLKTILIVKDLYHYISWKNPELCNYLKEQYFFDFTELGMEFLNVTSKDRKEIKNIEKEFFNEGL